MLTIENAEDLGNWLFDKPHMLSKVIAVRVALRVFPLWRQLNNRDDLTLAVIRAIFLSSTDAHIGGHFWTTAETSVRQAQDRLSRVRATLVQDFAHIPLASDVCARVAETFEGANAATLSPNNPVWEVTITIQSAYQAWALSAPGHEGLVWKSVEADINWLEANKVGWNFPFSELLSAPLWLPDSQIPNTVIPPWKGLQDQNVLGDHWSVWDDWFQGIFVHHAVGFAGLTYNEYMNFGQMLAHELDEFWTRDPIIVNEDIKARIEAIRNPPPPLPFSQIASVKPVWRDDILTLDDAISSNAETESLEALLQALSDDFRELADDLSGVANVDERALKMLRRLATQAAIVNLGRKEVFRLANRLLELQLYGQKVSKEWADENAVRYHALTVQLDNLIKTYPEVREYIEVLPKPLRVPEEVAAMLAVEEDIVAALGSEEARAFIDQAIPTALMSTKEDVLGDLGPLTTGYNATPRSMPSYENMLASLGNTLGPIAERAKKSIGNEIGVHADKAGPYLTKFLVSFYKQLTKMGKAASASVAVSVSTNNMEILAQSSPQLSAIAAIITYIALSYRDDSKNKTEK